jgi:hypothetical protein
MSVWLTLANEGMVKNETFCAATPSAMVFGKSDGDRFAVTRDLTLKPGYVLQFKVFMHELLSEKLKEKKSSRFISETDKGHVFICY